MQDQFLPWSLAGIAYRIKTDYIAFPATVEAFPGLAVSKGSIQDRFAINESAEVGTMHNKMCTVNLVDRRGTEARDSRLSFCSEKNCFFAGPFFII